MPRDANGNYTLPAGNPVATGTVISSTWANDTMSDLANEMSDSLSRSGKGGLTGPLPIVDKSGAVPGLSFSAEPTSGFKREGSGDVRVQVQGQDNIRWLGAGRVTEIWNPNAQTPAFEIPFTTPVAETIDGNTKKIQSQRLTTGGAIPVSLAEGQLTANVEDDPPTLFVGSTGGAAVKQFIPFPPGTKMLFYQDTAPAGWTIDQAVDEHVARLTKGSVAAGVAGGTSGGTYDFSVMFADLPETNVPGVGGHAITLAESASGHERNARRSDTDSSAGASSVKGLVDNTRTNFGNPHYHSIDLRAKWAACIVCTKD